MTSRPDSASRYPQLHEQLETLDHRLRFAYDEEERQSVLDRYQIIHAKNEASYDRLAVMLRKASHMDWSAITFVDRQRQWFKAQDGFAVKETPRNLSFCSVAMHSTQPLIVHDATGDPRFRHNALVTGEAKLRSYFGMPIYSEEGLGLGSVCLIATHRPRILRTCDTHLLTCAREWVHADLGQRRCLQDIEKVPATADSRQRSLALRQTYFAWRITHAWQAIETAYRQCIADK